MSKKPDKIDIGSSGQDAWQEEYDRGYKEAYNQSFRQSSLAERGRLSRIFGSPEAMGEGRVEAAQVMAFNSSLGAEVVIAILTATDRAYPELAIERAWNAVSARSIERLDPTENVDLGRQVVRSIN